MKFQSVLHNTILISIASIVTQIVSLVLIPIIGRNASVEDFGIFNAILADISLISIFLCLGLQQVVIVAKSKNMAILVYKLALLSSSIILILLFIFMIIFNQAHLKYFSEFFEYRYLIFILIAIEGIFIPTQILNLKLGNYIIISKSRILKTVISKGVLLFFLLLLGSSVYFFIYSEILAGIIISYLLFRVISKELSNINISLKKIRFIYSKYFSFSFSIMASDFLYRFNQVFLIFLITTYYGLGVLGNFSMATLLAAVPTTLLTSALSEVLFRELSFEKNSDVISNKAINLLQIIMIVALCIFVNIYFYGAKIAGLILGPKWIHVGPILKITVISSFSNFVFTPFISIFKLLNFQKYIVLFFISIIIFSNLAFYVGTNHDDYILSFLWNGIVSLMLSFIFLFVLFYKLKSNNMKILLDLAYMFLSALPLVILGFVYEYLAFENSFFMLLFIIIGSIAMFVINYLYLPYFRLITKVIHTNLFFFSK